KTKPRYRRRSKARWSRSSVWTWKPLKRNSPAVGTSRQPRMFIVVDFPDPDGPITATKSPASIVISTPLSAWKAAAPSPKVLVTPRSEISGLLSIAPAPFTRLAALLAERGTFFGCHALETGAPRGALVIGGRRCWHRGVTRR